MHSFLWVNNVAAITGGTLGATLSMTKAFPDCEHTVLSRSGEWTEEAQQLFGGNVSLVLNERPIDLMVDKAFDVVVYQNSPLDFIPSSHPQNPMTVYVLHSNRYDHAQCAARCRRAVVVSRWLRQKTNSQSPVLYQPVTIPANLGMISHEPFPNELQILRICTPNPRKWRLQDFEESLLAVDSIDRPMHFHFVGCPEETASRLMGKLNHPITFYEASWKARSLISECDILLYDTSLEESFGRTVREAQRCGTVPVVSRLGGFIEQITDGVDGFLCSKPSEFKTAIDNLIHPPTYSAVSSAALRKGEEGSLMNFRERFLKLLNQ